MQKKKEELENTIKIGLIKIIKEAVTRAPQDIINRLKTLKKRESNGIAKKQLELILKNFKYGARNEIPICQDTGVLNFFIELGSGFPIISNFQEIIEDSVKKANETIPLRGNSVDPITNENPENNLGINVPPIYLNIIEDSSDLKITVLAKGGGAENISKLFMLNPSNGFEIFQEKILETIKNAGGMPCPPIILGIGLGGDASKCMTLAKKALLRPLDSRNPRADVAKIERNLIKSINNLNIGVMGLGGNVTCLDARIEVAMRHPASYPVGLIVQCYSHRIASLKINQKGEIKYGI
ncbi:MAG: fumarate hydratase [Promethearchaeia archaeon]